jgi:hypothetical protein
MTARFVALLEPYGSQPAVSGFREVQPGVFEVRGPVWTDRIDLSGGPVSYQRTAHRIVPRLADSAREWTGIALLNAGGQAAEVACTALDDRGNPLQGSGITNPRTFTLGPGEQLARLASEMFGVFPGSAASQTGWVRVASSQPGIDSFFMFGDNRGTWLDGAGTPVALSTEFAFPGVPSRAGLAYDVEFSFVNPADSSVDLSLEFFDSGGSRRGVCTQAIPARGRLRAELASLCDPAGSVPGWLRGRASTGVAAFELFRASRAYEPGGETLHAGALHALSTENAAVKLFGAHFAAGGGWFTQFSLVNPGPTASEIEVRAFGNDGTPLAGTAEDARVFEIPATGSLNLSAAGLPGVSGSLRQEGYAEFTVRSGPGILGSITFGTEDGFVLASLPLNAMGCRRCVIPHVSQGPEWFTGVALLNPSNAQVPVTLTVYDAVGRRVGSKVLDLKARGKQARLLGEWVPESNLQQGGHAEVSAPEEIFCFALFGSRDLRLLSALPAQ